MIITYWIYPCILYIYIYGIYLKGNYKENRYFQLGIRAKILTVAFFLLLFPSSLYHGTPFISYSKIATAITCKLTRINFLLLKAQVVPILCGVQLFGFLDGTYPTPAVNITIGTSDATRQDNNLDHKA